MPTGKSNERRSFLLTGKEIYRQATIIAVSLRHTHCLEPSLKSSGNFYHLKSTGENYRNIDRGV